MVRMDPQTEISDILDRLSHPAPDEVRRRLKERIADIESESSNGNGDHES